MSKYIFDYGKGKIDLELKEGNIIGELSGNTRLPLEDIKEELYNTFENPIDSKALKDLVKSGDEITLVISDMTRFWMRQDLVIPHVINYLNKCGIKDGDISILIANGTHLPAPLSDIEILVTKEIAKRVKVINHYCEAKDLVCLGKTSRGTVVELNPLVVNQKTICLGAAAHHLMAGFGGGRKSILPGVASGKSIAQNHIHALSPNQPCSNPLIGNSKLDGNPLNEDMCEAAAMVNPIFIINLAMNPEGKLCRIFSGNWMNSWLECCKYVDEMYSVQIPEKVDVVFAGCGGYPKDMSMYQSTKVIDNVESAVKPGGTIILISQCIDGGGPDEYFGWSKHIEKGRLDEELRKNFTIPGYIFYQNCEIAERIKIYMISSIDPELLEPMGIVSFKTAQELMENLDLKDKSIYIIKKGGTVIPKVKE
ncbi:nickel-dependent lactate racemase family protein [Proteocatella sphenisci]|uniref:nickel-dependent lactate racemase n=1 Tax=Proteocatella sphenisci TaxID=181070 RepID=UPI00048B6516|nr:nickel-dependent lactate racemase [Proteocatella sphenisci]